MSICKKIFVGIICFLKFNLNIFFQKRRCKKYTHSGKSSCSWGKTEWCATAANAKRCKVMTSNL